MSTHTGTRGDTRLRFSGPRVGAAVTLAAWAGLFWFLMISGRTSLYLSTRTSWLIPLGAVLASIAAIGRIASARVRDPEPLGIRETWMFGVIVLPVVLLLALPPVSLNSYAVNRRSNSTGIGSSARVVSGPIDLVDVAAARAVVDAQAALKARAGERVSIEGFVTEESGEADRFQLTRFVITCCVADATISYVTVVDAPPGTFETDQWVRVTGPIYPLGSDILVQAQSIEPIDAPAEPYLTP
ncbi:MAG: TIGR03943 family protein [Actinomycetota bacterium]|nr:TIGR03943 family protein [Actinomycetota bacterium]MDH5224212.1 TIGR03943 family protein [Actinomycetota bacterium]MDH5312683.1 TIGR03943 family protein [Actinomycetota bacterium]